MTVEIKCGYVDMLPLSEIQPHPENPNKHDKDQITRLGKLFSHYGVRHPIIVSTLSGYIVAGHGRLMAAKLLKMNEFPVDYQDFTDSDEEYGFMVADNAVSEWSELNLSFIHNKLADIGPMDIELLGIKDFVVDLAEHPEPKEKKEPKKTQCPNCGEKF